MMVGILGGMADRVMLAHVSDRLGQWLDRRSITADALADMAKGGYPLADDLATRLSADKRRLIPAAMLRRAAAWGEPEYRCIVNRLAASYPAHARVLGEHWSYFLSQIEQVKAALVDGSKRLPR